MHRSNFLKQFIAWHQVVKPFLNFNTGISMMSMSFQESLNINVTTIESLCAEFHEHPEMAEILVTEQ